MDCDNPYISEWGAFPCGGCLPCRIVKRRVWTHRILLEAMEHENNCFLTLTYSDDRMPEGNSLDPRHTQGFLKRLRASVPYRFRYFLCGEYGELHGRPDYHAAMFGFPGCEHGVTRLRKSGYCCSQCELVKRRWSFGNVFLAPLEPKSAAYIAGYVTKKFTPAKRLGGRHPEFARMSRRPGIGTGMMFDVADTLMKHGLDETIVDVPVTLKHGGKEYPLGVFLRKKLREYIGRDSRAPQEVLEALKAEMQPLRESAWNDKTSTLEKVLEESLGRRLRVEGRYRATRKGR